MSEILAVVDPPVIHFGKYSGKSAAQIMADDPQYVQWILAQPWFQEKNPKLVQFFISGGGSEASETPEHNALQAKFIQDAYCLAVAAMFSAGQKLRTLADVKRRVDETVEPALSDYVVTKPPSISNRSFEQNSWDVQFSFNGAAGWMSDNEEPECSCTPLPEVETGSIYSKSATTQSNRLASGFSPVRYEQAFDKAMEAYVEATQHESACLRSLRQYFWFWGRGERTIFGSAYRDELALFRLELKPIMGDDFPAVLRQVLGYMNRRSSYESFRTAVVVGHFQSAAVPWPVVQKQFWESGVLLMQESDLDKLVELHADEWGTSSTEEISDFTVDFTAQL